MVHSGGASLKRNLRHLSVAMNILVKCVRDTWTVILSLHCLLDASAMSFRQLCDCLNESVLLEDIL